MIPGTLIEDLKISVTEYECIVFINLRYGNRFSLHIFKKSGAENFQRFRDVLSSFRMRVANIHKDVNLAWIKDFKQVMRINSKYEDPSAIVTVTISNYLRGMTELIDELKLKKDLQHLDNIVPV